MSENKLIELFQLGHATIVVSDLTLVELQDAPQSVRAVLDSIPAEHREDVELAAEAASLADAYIAAGVVAASKLVDAQHIAIATISRIVKRFILPLILLLNEFFT